MNSGRAWYNGDGRSLFNPLNHTDQEEISWLYPTQCKLILPKLPNN